MQRDQNYRIGLTGLCILCLCQYATAQYKGGSGDGTGTKLFSQLNPLVNIYKGTYNDGFASAKILNRNALPNVYNGKNGDGFGYAFIGQQNYQPNIYTGGSGDGNSYTSLTGENRLENIYSGGDADGFTTYYVLHENNSVNIYNGGDGDGASAGQVLSQNAFNNIYNGGNSDGFAMMMIYQSNQTGIALNLEGEWQQEDIVLHWTDGNEKEAYSYELERSNGEEYHFVKIAVFDAGKIKEQAHTGYTDTDTRSAEIFYYRVKRFDQNGKAESSAIIKFVKAARAVTYTIYPNPGQGIFNISIKGEKNIAVYSFRVLNNNGTVLHKGNILSSLTQFNISHLAAGMYYVQLFKESRLQHTYKIILQH